ncbi:MAG: hypothetical protein CML20_23515 [Rheinheimera sp.]|uniref:PEP-CTERM sorting domain-containing protein n=1 Tax=Arsukibacterium sp. UBA3155 TaxID=1946058 RepID=UPI000C89A0A1|nr:PEP-CTERM sorting domain-containing protein [Arsukibacterium sp. UBA3155]MAD77696.1 hypothetical protein [Rheinheimera sp.]|tara:strand:- start:61087 stop:61695 length:609 start_codon:yes stop_codon:yes gene_type:complete
MKKALSLILALSACSANAAIIDIEYEWDGSTFTSIYGNNLFGTVLNVGDTLNLTFTALDTNYWDFSAVSITGNVNLGFEYPGSCGTRSSEGSYNAGFDGSSVLSANYSEGSQSCIHMGPENIDFSSVNMIDSFSISYTMNSSTAGENIVGSYSETTWWQIWEQFGMTGRNVVIGEVATEVPAPSSLALFGIALLALRRFAKR